MKALILDTETTDLIKNSLLPEDQQPRVIEYFGQIVEDDGTVLDKLQFLCNPGHALSETTTKITGIKNSDVKGQPPFSHFEEQVRQQIASADAIVAHNLGYDWDMLNFEFKRCGTEKLVVWPKIRICTVEQTEWYKGFRLNLTALHEYLFGEPFKDAHRAETDVNALTRCYLEMRRRGDI